MNFVHYLACLIVFGIGGWRMLGIVRTILIHLTSSRIKLPSPPFPPPSVPRVALSCLAGVIRAGGWMTAATISRWTHCWLHLFAIAIAASIVGHLLALLSVVGIEEGLDRSRFP